MTEERLNAIEFLLDQILDKLSPHYKKVVREAIDIYVDAKIAVAARNTLR